MKTVGNLPRCLDASRKEFRDNIIRLVEGITSDERGKSIANAVQSIEKNRQAIEEQKNAHVPNEKKITKAQENIQNNINIIKLHATRLGAKPDVLADIEKDLRTYDFQQVTLKVLKLMAQKNPGLHQRKYNQALQMVAAQQRQH